MGYNGKGIKWDDNKIKEKITEIMKVLNVNRMPSAKEMTQVLHCVRRQEKKIEN